MHFDSLLGLLLEPGLTYEFRGSLALFRFEDEQVFAEHLQLVRPDGKIGEISTSKYYRRHWAPDLGPTWVRFREVLLDMALHNPNPSPSVPELQRRIGVAHTTIRNMIAFWKRPEWIDAPRENWPQRELIRWIGARLYVPLIHSPGPNQPYTFRVCLGDHKHPKHRPDLWRGLHLEQPAFLFDDEWEEGKTDLLESFGDLAIYSVISTPNASGSGGRRAEGGGQSPARETGAVPVPGISPPEAEGGGPKYLGTTATRESYVVHDTGTRENQEHFADLRRQVTTALLAIKAPDDVIEALIVSPQSCRFTLCWVQEIGPTKRWWPKWHKGPTHVWLRSAVAGCVHQPESSWAREYRDWQARKAETRAVAEQKARAAATKKALTPAPEPAPAKGRAVLDLGPIPDEFKPLWEALCEACGADAYESWLRDCRPHDLTLEGVFYVLCPNATAKVWLNRRYGMEASAALAAGFPNLVKQVIFINRAEAAAQTREEPACE